MWFDGILSNSRRKTIFKALIVSYFLVDILASRIDHTEKSGEYGGHCCEEMKLRFFFLYKRLGFTGFMGWCPSLVEMPNDFYRIIYVLS